MSEINVPALEKRLREKNLIGILALVQFLEKERKSGRQILKIGSATIDFYGRVAALKTRSYTHEEYRLVMDSLAIHHFGRSDGTITPIEDLAGFTEGVLQLSPVHQERLDSFCADLAAPTDEDYQIIQAKLIVYRPVQ